MCARAWWAAAAAAERGWRQWSYELVGVRQKGAPIGVFFTDGLAPRKTLARPPSRHPTPNVSACTSPRTPSRGQTPADERHRSRRDGCMLRDERAGRAPGANQGRAQRAPREHRFCLQVFCARCVVRGRSPPMPPVCVCVERERRSGNTKPQRIDRLALRVCRSRCAKVLRKRRARFENVCARA